MTISNTSQTGSENAQIETRLTPTLPAMTTPQTTLKLPAATATTTVSTIPTPSRMASHKTILVEENVFAKLQALQKNSNYFMAHGVQHQLGASIDLSVIATALIRLALNNQSLCDAAVTEALETIRKQLAKISSSPTTTHREQ